MLEKYLKNFGFEPAAIERIMIVRNTRTSAKTDDIILKNIEDNIALMRRMGYTDREIVKIMSSIPVTFLGYADSIVNKFRFFQTLGFTLESFKRTILKTPELLRASLKKAEEVVAYFQEKGFANRDIVQMFKMTPAIAVSSITKLESHFLWAKSLGLTDEECIRFFTFSPTVLCQKISSLDEKIDWFRIIGLDRKESTKLILKAPSIMIMGTKRFDSTYRQLEDLGFEKEEIKSIICAYPQIFNLKTTTFQEKYSCFLNNGLREYFIKKPSILMQSAELTRMRIAHLTSIGLWEQVHKSAIFINSTAFKKRFGVSNDELLKMYATKEEEL